MNKLVFMCLLGLTGAVKLLAPKNTQLLSRTENDLAQVEESKQWQLKKGESEE